MIKKLLNKSGEGESDGSFFLKKSFLALILRAGGMLTQYIFIFVIARLYGPKEQGSFTLSFTILQLFAIFSQMGLDNRLTRVIAANSDSEGKNIVRSTYLQSLRFTLTAAVIWAILTYLASPWLASVFFSKPELTDDLRMTCLAFVPFVIIGLNSAGFRGYKNMTGFMIFRALQPLIAAILLLIFYYGKMELGAIQAYSITTIIICIFSFTTWYKFSKIGEAETIPTPNAGSVMMESMPLMLTGSIFFILGWTDNIILGIFRTSEEVGIYDMAYKLSTLSAIVLLAVNAIQAPTFAQLYNKGEMKRLQGFVFRSTKLLFFTSLPVTLVLCLFPEWILGIFGPGFKAAALTLIILSIGNFVNSITGSIGILLQMSGKQKEYNRIIMIAAGGSILMNFILIPRIGIVGAAISSTVAKIFQNLASVAYAKRSMGILSLYLPGIDKIFKVKDKNN